MREAKDIWAERVRLLAPYQVNADLMRKTRAGKRSPHAGRRK